MAKMKTISIEASSDDKYKVSVRAGERTLYIDQPVFAGGTDAGANPVEYLFSSLAGCIATTARIIANQKKVTLNGMDMKIEGSFDTDVLLGKSMDSRPVVTGINVSVTIDSEMSETERNGFLDELRLRCPVADTLGKGTPIHIAAARM